MYPLAQRIKRTVFRLNQKDRQEVVLNMLKNRLDTTIICKVTGLSEKEINKLKKQSKQYIECSSYIFFFKI